MSVEQGDDSVLNVWNNDKIFFKTTFFHVPTVVFYSNIKDRFDNSTSYKIDSQVWLDHVSSDIDVEHKTTFYVLGCFS